MENSKEMSTVKQMDNTCIYCDQPVYVDEMCWNCYVDEQLEKVEAQCEADTQKELQNWGKLDIASNNTSPRHSGKLEY